jgi:ComF family protein
MLRPLARTAPVVSNAPLRRLIDAGRTLSRAALDLLYPPLCVACGARLPVVATTAVPLCESCRRLLPTPTDDVLPARLARYPEGPTRFKHALVLWIFDSGGVLQAVQHAFKYGGRPQVAEAAGRLVATAWERAGYPRPDVVVPVPLARTRLLERGYNQSERLSAGLACALNVPTAPDLLARVRGTRPQTALSRERRRENVAGVFEIADDKYDLEGCRVLLVDDVLTTGATVLAASEPLQAAGAAVDLAVLALTRE